MGQGREHVPGVAGTSLCLPLCLKQGWEENLELKNHRGGRFSRRGMRGGGGGLLGKPRSRREKTWLALTRVMAAEPSASPVRAGLSVPSRCLWPGPGRFPSNLGQAWP